MPVAVSSDPTRYIDIITAIYDVANTQAGLTWAGGNLYEIPTPAQLEVGVPYLAVRQGDLDNWALGGEDIGPYGQRLIGAMEPNWSFEVFAIFTYSDTQPNHGVAAQYLVSLLSAYTLNFDLEGTCATSEIIAGKQNTGLTYLSIGGTLYRAAKLTIGAQELLMVRY